MLAPLTIAEARAHVAIMQALDDADRFGWHWSETQRATATPLQQFRTRCNCRRVLNWSPWVDGVRVAWCICGMRVRECR